MEEQSELSEESSGVYVELEVDGEEDVNLSTIIHRLIAATFFPNSDAIYESTPLIRRIKSSLSNNLPLVPQAARNTASDILIWTRRGTPLRSLLVLSAGAITFLSLTGLIVFMMFFVAATINVILISLLMSLAAAGGFLAFFFMCLSAIYVGALLVSVFVISTATIFSIIALFVAAGWVGLFWTACLASKKIGDLAALAKYLILSEPPLSTYDSISHN